jgi:hypothetical protein
MAGLSYTGPPPFRDPGSPSAACSPSHETDEAFSMCREDQSHEHIFFFLISFNNLPTFLAAGARWKYYGRVSRPAAFPRQAIRQPDVRTVARQVTV